MVLLSTRMGRYRACALGAVAALTHGQAVAQQAPASASADSPPSTISAPDSAIERNASSVPNQPLSIEQAVALAAARSHALVSQAESARAARESAIAAGQRPDPIGRVAIENLPVDGSAAWSLSRDFMTMRSIGISQAVDKWRDAGRRRALRARGRTLRSRAASCNWPNSRARRPARGCNGISGSDSSNCCRNGAARRRCRSKPPMQHVSKRNAGAGRCVRRARGVALALDERILLRQSQLAAARIALARWIGGAEAASLGDHRRSPFADRLGRAAACG